MQARNQQTAMTLVVRDRECMNYLLGTNVGRYTGDCQGKNYRPKHPRRLLQHLAGSPEHIAHSALTI
jgi:hypothetical protein